MAQPPSLGHQRRLLLAASVLFLAGCIPLPRGHSLTRKTVAAKEGEATLVADDGARCRVPPSTFTAVQPGEEHACVWKEVDSSTRTPTPSAPRAPRQLPGQPHAD
jgi:hypothetical protein